MEEEELIKRAMSVIGSRRTVKKGEAARANGLKGGRPAGGRPLLEFKCTCDGGNKLTAEAHRTYCPRGRAIRRRLAAGLPLK